MGEGYAQGGLSRRIRPLARPVQTQRNPPAACPVPASAARGVGQGGGVRGEGVREGDGFATAQPILRLRLAA